jgi:predicted Fe-S protein YdhL (DUF1289 family)
VLDSPVKTPCIGVCSTGIGDRVCRGCKRFVHEVINWNSYSNDEKRLIDQRLGDFLSRCTRNKLCVADSGVLERQLKARQIPYPSHQDAYCWAYALLKAGAAQIDDPAAFGIEIDAGYRDLPLPELRQIIDQEFYVLSEAYYERYVSMGDTA